MLTGKYIEYEKRGRILKGDVMEQQQQPNTQLSQGASKAERINQLCREINTASSKKDLSMWESLLLTLNRELMTDKHDDKFKNIAGLLHAKLPQFYPSHSKKALIKKNEREAYYLLNSLTIDLYKMIPSGPEGNEKKRQGGYY